MDRLNWIWVVVACMGIYSCSDDDDGQESSSLVGESVEEVSHTSLVYLVADNSLSSYAALDVAEMKEGYAGIDDTGNNHLLVYIDDYNTPKLLQIIQEDGVVTVDTLATYAEWNSLDVDNMSAVMATAFEAYPADSYGLTLWSHGSGWLPGTDQKEDTETRAFGEDLDNDVNADGVQMDILDLAAALASGPHLDYLVFDACNMQGVEVAYELKDYTDYMIASPAEIPAYGAPYEDMVPAFFSGEDAPEAITAAYYGAYAENYGFGSQSGGSGPPQNSGGVGGFDGGVSSGSDYGYGIAISMVRTDALVDLASATENILSSYIAVGDEVSTSGVYSYDANFYNFYYDLDGFVQGLTGGGSDYVAWKEAYDTAVPLFLTTEYTYSSYAENGEGGMVSMADATGLSTFVPNNSDLTTASYWAYYLAVADAYPQYAYLSDDISAYLDELSGYYQGFAWDVGAGWQALGY